jgi:hypothetical protein
MPKYRVYLQAVASTSIEVEAADKDEAYELATSGDLPTICAHCSGWGRSQNLDLSEVWEIPGDDVEQGVEEVTSADA